MPDPSMHHACSVLAGLELFANSPEKRVKSDRVAQTEQNGKDPPVVPFRAQP